MTNRVIAEVFPPGDFIKEELEAREWSQTDLAEVLGRSVRLVNEIVNGKRAITPETATGLAKAFGTSAQFWMNLESSWQLSKLGSEDDAIARRARLYGKFPVKEMIRRSWIDNSSSLDVLETRFAQFFKVENLDCVPHLRHAAKKTHYDDTPSPQLAWLFRVRQIAESMVVPAYSERKLRDAVSSLASLRSEPEETRHVPRLLAECGVRFLIVESLPQSKIDGVCFWLQNAPVIALSIRFDRIDNFWFVLRHEIEHALRKHGQTTECIDVELDQSSLVVDQPQEEVLANTAAADFCVPAEEMNDFVARVKPFFSEQRVLLFAQRLQIHPGLVVGQIQRRTENYAFLKRYLVKVRQYLTGSAMTDGWGNVAPMSQ